METSCTPSSSSSPDTRYSNLSGIEPVEIVSEEEMAFIEAALASTRAALTSSSSAAAVSTLSFLKRRGSSILPCSATRSVHSAAAGVDIEDSARWNPNPNPNPTPPRRISLLQQFRPRRALAVTDLTSTEWCQKQMEFVLLKGKPKKTKAMKAGSDRHSELEKEVLQTVQIQAKSIEESWAIKLLNFVAGTNQLLFEGLTRELPVIGIVEGIWMIGVIDEIQKPEDALNPFLLDTKTRYTQTLPSEAQKRNARLQLMCYKYLWDSLIADKFPTNNFFSYFGLNPLYMLSDDIKVYSVSLGFDAKTLDDVVTYFRNACCLLSPSQEQLLLRYEWQSDFSLLEEYRFAYDAGWFEGQIKDCLKFWQGERDATYVSEPEKWKCKSCSFTDVCPNLAT